MAEIDEDRVLDMFSRAEMRWMSVEDAEITVRARDIALLGRERHLTRKRLSETLIEVTAEMEERTEAAVRRIKGVRAELRRWDYKNIQSSQTAFQPQIRALDEALELLDPKVKLA